MTTVLNYTILKLKEHFMDEVTSLTTVLNYTILKQANATGMLAGGLTTVLNYTILKPIVAELPETGEIDYRSKLHHTQTIATK